MTTICFYCTVISLAQKKTEDTVFWLEKIITHKPVDSMPALRCVAHFLRILVVATSPSLSSKYNTDRWLASLPEWLIANKFNLEYFKDYLEILTCFCADQMNRTHGAEFISKLKTLQLEHTQHDQMGIFLAVTESFLVQKPFEETVRPYI